MSSNFDFFFSVCKLIYFYRESLPFIVYLLRVYYLAFKTQHGGTSGDTKLLIPN